MNFFFHRILWEIWENIGTILRASNSEVTSPMWLKFELVRGFMPLLNVRKSHEDPIKNELDKPRTAISMTDTTYHDGYYNTILEALKIMIRE